MYCRHCGASIPDDSVFCSKCGKNVTDVESQSVKILPEDNKPDTEEKDEGQIEWYYKDATREVGPCTQDEIETAIRRGQVDIEGQVKIGQEGQWFKLMESRYATLIQSLSPIEVAISDKWIWCLGIIPMLVSLFIDRTGTTFGIPYFSFIAPLALNLLFIWLDNKELVNAGMLAESWMYMGIIIVPAYLVVREIKTNHNYSPAIVWCFLFAIGYII